MSKKIDTCLAYCREQNGINQCKNCGLTQEMIDDVDRIAREEERERWLNQTLVYQYVHVQWDGEKISEYHLDEVDYEHLDDQHLTVEEDVAERMKGKTKGSYSIKIVKYFVEGQISHPETGQWDFPPYYELSDIYYKNDTSNFGYKALTTPKDNEND